MKREKDIKKTVMTVVCKSCNIYSYWYVYLVMCTVRILKFTGIVFKDAF